MVATVQAFLEGARSDGGGDAGAAVVLLPNDGGRRVCASWDLDVALTGGVAAALHHFVAYWGNNGQI